MTDQKYSISAASRIANKGRATIARHIKQGKLSYELAQDGTTKLIDGSELIRVYGDECVFGNDSSGVKDSKKKDTKASSELKLVDQVLESTKREREQLENQIARIEKDFDDAKAYFEKSLNLLEDKRDKGADQEWRQAVDRLTERIANQEHRHAQEQEAQKQEATAKLRDLEQRYKKKLEAERNKSFFKKLFG